MADERISEQVEDVAPVLTDLLVSVDAPLVSNKKVQITNVLALYNALTATLTNKTFDQDGAGNSITNLANASIKAAAAIDATKIADGTVTSAEFQFINTVSSNVQTQLDAKLTDVTGSALLNARIWIGDGANLAQEITMSGDVFITNAGLTTIQANAVADAEIAAHTSTKITITAKGQLNSNIVYTDQTNTFGAFQQRFPTTQLQLDNPAQTSQYILATSAIAGDRTVTFPLLTGNDTLVLEAFAQTLTGKTINADGAGNVITNIGSSEIKSEMITGFGTVTGVSGDFVLISDTGDAGNLKKVDVVDFLGGASLPVVDTTSIAEGSADATKEVRFEVDGNATSVIGVLATIFSTAKTVTFPDATDTLMGKATVDVMTNKSYNADGTGNVITNVGSSEVKSELITGQATVTAASGDFVFISDTGDAGNLKKVDALDFLGGTSLPVVDTTSIAEGSADATKEVRFEVDGNSTGIVGVLATTFTTAKTLTFPDATDTLVAKATTDVFTNKSYDANGTGNVLTNVGDAEIETHTSTKITITAKGQLNSAIVYTDQANVFGAFDNSFQDLRFQINNPANTFQYIFDTNAIVADRNVILPLLTGNDTFVFNAFAATLTNKTYDADGAGNVLTNVGSSEIKSEIITGFSTVTGISGDFVLISDTTDSGNLKKVDVVDFLGGASLPVVDTTSIAEGSADATKEVRFEVDGNTTGIIGVIATIFTTAKTVTLPNATDTLMGKATTDVMTNKSYDLGGAGNVLTGSVAEFNTALQSETFAYIGVANVWADGVKQVFNPNGTNAGVNVGQQAGNPSSAVNGDIYYDSTANQIKGVVSGSPVDLGGAGSQTPWTSDINADTFALTWLDEDAVLPSIGVEYITNHSAGLRYNVATGKVHEFAVNGSNDMTLNVTTLDMLGHDINNVNFLTSNATNPASTGFLRMDGGDVLSFRNFDNDDTKRLGIGNSTGFEPWIFDSSSGVGPQIRLTATASAGQVIGSFQWYNDNAAASSVAFGGIFVDGINLTTGSHDGKMRLHVTEDGTTQNYIELNQSDGRDITFARPLDMTNKKISDIGETTFTDLTLVTGVAGDIIMAVDATDGLFKKIDVTDFLAAAAQTPWTSDIDAAGFDLFALGGTTAASAGALRLANDVGIAWRNAANTADFVINFDSTDRWDFTAPSGAGSTIAMARAGTAPAGTLGFLGYFGQTLTGGTLVEYAGIRGDVANNSDTVREGELRFNCQVAGATTSFMHMNDAESGVTEMDKPVRMALANALQFTDADASITGVTNDLEYDVGSADEHRWRVADANEMRLTAAELNLENNKLANVNPTTITDFSLVTAVTGDLVWIIDLTDGLSKKVNVADFLSAASQTPWTSDIDAAGFDLTELGSTTAAATGAIRLGNLGDIAWRNAADSGDAVLRLFSTDSFEFIAANDGGTALRLSRTAAAPSGTLGNFGYYGRTSTSSIVVSYAAILGDVADNTDGAIWGELRFHCKVNNVTTSFIHMNEAKSGLVGFDRDGQMNARRFNLAKGSDEASASELTLSGTGNVYDVTGTTTVNTISPTGWQAGSVIHLQFDGILTVTHNSGGTNDILLGNQANMTTAAADVLTLFFNGTDWVEISRSSRAGGSDTPWVVNHDAAEFNLINVGLLNQKTDNTTAIFEMEANHTTPAADQVIGRLDFIDDSSTGVRRTYGQIRGLIEDPTNTTEDGQVFFGALKAGSISDYIVLNENNNDYVNVKNLLFKSSFNAANEDRAIMYEDSFGFRINARTGERVRLSVAGATKAQLLSDGRWDLQNNDLTWNGGGFAHDIKVLDASMSFNVGVSTDTYNWQTGDATRMTMNTSVGLQMTAIRLQSAKGADEASATELTLATDGNTFDVTGTTTINTISPTSWQAGAVIHLQFDGITTVTHNSGGTNDILLGNQANMTTAAGDVLSLFFNGTDWVEISRSVVAAGGGGATIELDNLGTTAVNATINMGSNIITFGNANTSITGVTADLEYDVATGETHRFRVNNATEYEFDSGTFNINGNTITNTGVLTLPTATDTLVGRLTTDTFTNKTYDADGTGNVLTNVGSSEIKSEIITGQATVTAISGDFLLFSDTSDSGNLKKVDALDFLAAAGEVFTWTANHSAADFDFLAKPTPSTDFFEMLVEVTPTDDAGTEPIYHINIRRDDVTTIQNRPLMEISDNDIPQLEIRLNGDLDLRNNDLQLQTGGIFFQTTDESILTGATTLDISTAAAHTIRFHVDSPIEMTISSTIIDFQANTITNGVCSGTITGNTGITGLGTMQSDIVMNGNDINLGAAGTVFFSATDTAISEQAGSMFFDVPTTESFSWDIAGTPEMTLNATILDIKNNVLLFATGETISMQANDMIFDVTTADSFSFDINDTPEYTFSAANFNLLGNNLTMGAGEILFTTGGTSISEQSSDMIFDVSTGDFFSFDIAGVPEVTISATQMDLTGMNLVNAVTTATVTGVSGITGLGTQAQDLAMGGNDITNVVNIIGGTDNTIEFDERAGDPTVAANKAVLYAKDVGGNTHLFQDNSTESPIDLTTGSEVTTWTADHSAAGFDLNSLSNLLFQDTAGAPSTTDRSIHYEDDEGMVFNALTGDFYQFEINGVNEMNLTNTTLDIQNNNLTVGSGSIDFLTAGTSISEQASDLIYDVSTGDIHSFDIAGSPEMTLSATVLDIQNNILQFATGETIAMQANDMIFDVTSGDTFSFDIAGTPELVIAGATINAATATFQEAGVDISPIGVHDIPINATGMYATTTLPATGLTQTEFGTNDIDLQTWDFTSTTADERVQFRSPLPRNYNNGAITVTINWSQASGSGNVVWRVGAVATGQGEAIDAAFTFSADLVDAGGTANQVQSTTTASFTPAGTPVDDDEIHFEVMRQGSDSLDTFSGTARLHSIVLHITTDAATAA